MREENATLDAAVAEIAARQHGVVSVSQLGAVGIDKSGITRRIKAGRLHRIHRGVYAVGHRGLSQHGWWTGAVLACGEGAVLSHGSAAALWGLLRPIEGPIDVTVATRNGRERRRGIRIHRCATLAAAPSGADSSHHAGGIRPGRLVTRRDGIPVTNVPRTLTDLRGTVPPHLHRRAIRQAELAGFALGEGIDGDRTRSDLERDFLCLCRSHGLPPPEVNVQIGRWTVDFLWRGERLAVETDSFRYHRGSVAFEDDHQRDLDLRARGLKIRRFTGRQLREEPDRVVADVAAALTAAAPKAASAAS